MVMADYRVKKERALVDAETIKWAAEYTLKYGPPLWASKALERAQKNLEELSRHARFWIHASGQGVS